MVKNIKTGDRVWCYDKWSETPMEAEVTDLYEYNASSTAYGHLNGKTVAKLHVKGWGSTDRFLTEIFPTREACLQHIKEKNDARQAGYEAEITDVESLVRFLYSHNVTTGNEYADYEARNAARKKAKELLGIDLGE